MKRRIRPMWAGHLVAAVIGLALGACSSEGGDGVADAGGQGDVVADAADVAADAGVDTAHDIGGDSIEADADANDTDAAPPFGSELHAAPARCGLGPYAWLGPDKVADITIWRAHALSTLTPQTMGAMLSQAGLKELPAGLTHPVANFELRYTTQDKGKLVEATAVVSVPTDMGAGLVPALVWQHGTTGWMDDCAPSKDLSGVGMTALLAGFGYIVVAPDYLGQRGFGDPSPAGSIHPYLIGEPTAIASIDALRAVERQLATLASLPKPDRAHLGLIGASQGGHAVLMTERFLPHYAPEWTLQAAVALVPPADLRVVAQAAIGQASAIDGRAGLFAAAFTAMHQWYEADASLTEVFTDADPAHVASQIAGWLSGGCKVAKELASLTQVVELYASTFVQGAATGKFGAPWQCFLDENSVASTSIPRLRDVPILMSYSENDDLVLPALEKPSFEAMCAAGYRLQWHECAGAGHAEGAARALPYALAWISARMQGDALPAAELCKPVSPTVCE